MKRNGSTIVISLASALCVVLNAACGAPGPSDPGKRHNAAAPVPLEARFAQAEAAPAGLHAASLKLAASQAGNVAATIVITLTAGGFSPAILNVISGTQVTWYNATAQAQLLVSGAPHTLFLPVIAHAATAASLQMATEPLVRSSSSIRSPQALVNGDSFSGTLAAGGAYSHVFNFPGTIPYFLLTAPRVRGSVLTLGPDPSTIAPPVNRSVSTDLCTAAQFLYSGGAPIQTNVASGAISCQHIALLRGKVLSRDGLPLPGVAVSVLHHPEFGQTLSRADGAFDLAVNGGGMMNVMYSRNDYLSAQRQVNAPWQDYARLPDVMLTPADPTVTAIDLSLSAPFQVARGSTVSDTHGQRRATLLFPQGVTAQLIISGSAPVQVTSLHVRSTEFSQGSNGPQAMPATLPPASGYMFAQVFGADEAANAGAKNVVFSRPLIEYLENYLSFTVGLTLPMGSYDPERGMWSDSGDGRVIKVLSSSGGMATLDLDGSGLPASPAALAALGITDAERQQVATLYAPGQSLWRMLVPHFDQPYDT